MLTILKTMNETFSNFCNETLQPKLNNKLGELGKTSAGAFISGKISSAAAPMQSFYKESIQPKIKKIEDSGAVKNIEAKTKRAVSFIQNIKCNF